MNGRDPVDVLARTAWGEARGDGKPGMAAICSVVLNRAAHPSRLWGQGVIGVCLAPGQFACWMPGADRRRLLAVTGANEGFVAALRLAEQAVAGQLADSTHGAVNYFRAGARVPAWALGRAPCARIGHHLFFKL